jgi:hypothetical protein
MLVLFACLFVPRSSTFHLLSAYHSYCLFLIFIIHLTYPAPPPPIKLIIACLMKRVHAFFSTSHYSPFIHPLIDASLITLINPIAPANHTFSVCDMSLLPSPTNHSPYGARRTAYNQLHN